MTSHRDERERDTDGGTPSPPQRGLQYHQQDHLEESVAKQASSLTLEKCAVAILDDVTCDDDVTHNDDVTHDDDVTHIEDVTHIDDVTHDRYLDGFYSPNNRSTVDNVYIAEAAGAMAAIATAVGKAADAAKYAAIGAKIRATVVAQFFDAKTGLFIDGDMSTHSALSAQYFPAAFGFVGASAASSSSSSSNYSAAGDVSDMQAAAVGSRARALSKKTYKQKRATTIGNVKPMLDLIENKTSIARASEPACSCMGGHWLLQGLYNIGATTEDAAQGARAAAMAQAFIESPWTWRLMIAAGATTTMEVWTTRDKPNLSWSHPW